MGRELGTEVAADGCIESAPPILMPNGDASPALSELRLPLLLVVAGRDEDVPATAAPAPAPCMPCIACSITLR
jgi:hypothetical protein